MKIRSRPSIQACRVAAAIAVCACGGSSEQAPPLPLSGAYVLESFNGAAIPAHPSSDIVVDTGYATLWPVGYYEIYVRRFVGGQAENYIFESGHWSSSNGAIQFSAGAASKSASDQSDGHFTVQALVGTQQTLRFRRNGDAPVTPVRLFDNANAPTYVGSLAVTGSGPTMTVSATMNVANSDVIGRALAFTSSCRASMWVTTDSLTLNPLAWTDNMSSDLGCGPQDVIDTISAGGQKNFVDSRQVNEFKSGASNTSLPAGRYFVWVLSDLGVPFFQTRSIRLGGITIAP
jgi:hypothetical protein